jgi:hypothetical protein
MSARVGRLGFTGTRRGMTGAQLDAVDKLIVAMTDDDKRTEFHHGGCVGADMDFHMIANEYGPVIVHPGPDGPLCAKGLRGCPIWLPAKSYLARNRDIVDACDLLIAAPHGPEEQRSGTWSTVRYARKVGRPVVVVWPDGRETNG